ncbi:MAG: hypothetical protein KF729_17670 [Sandaracinaceae bacterium]|nr:hypothetical protein [Sandaracinaceae bacterium]
MRRARGWKKSWMAFGVALALLPSCGGAVTHERPLEPVPVGDESVELERAQRREADALEVALARREPDCATACGLETRICDLADRICAIAGRRPADRETRARCEDGARRCEDARARVAGSCACAP